MSNNPKPLTLNHGLVSPIWNYEDVERLMHQPFSSSEFSLAEVKLWQSWKQFQISSSSFFWGSCSKPCLCSCSKSIRGWARYPLLHFHFSLRLVRPWDKLSWRTRAKAFDGCVFLRRKAPKLSPNKIQGEVPYKHQGIQTTLGSESASERKRRNIEPKHQFLGFHVSFLLGVYFEEYPACCKIW